MATSRLDMIQGMKADMHTWYWEIKDKIYKKLPRYYEKLAEVLPIKSIKGGFWQGTTAISEDELQDRTNSGEFVEVRPQEGYTVYGAIKDKAARKECPRELKRDWHRTADWLKDYVQTNWPNGVEVTKEKIVAAPYNYGGYTSGHEATFNNDDATIGLTTYSSPNLCYDAKPFFNRSGNNRAGKYQTTGTYYNAVALAGVNFDNAKTMYNLLTATNNVKDNGQPFDNSSDIAVACHPSLALDWEVVNNSTLNPDNAENATNPLKGAFKNIIANPYFTTASFSCLLRSGMGLKFFVNEPKFNFWEEPKTDSYWASVVFDYALCVWNWRPFVANNAPTSA